MEREPDSAPEPVVIAGDYRLTRHWNGIKIEVLDYHADPLVLTKRHLRLLFETEQDH